MRLCNKTVARDAGAGSPHQVMPVYPRARPAGLCWGGGGVSVGFRGVVTRCRVDLGSLSLKDPMKEKGLKAECSDEPT